MTCKGTNCTSDGKTPHSSECLFEYRANIASGIKEVTMPTPTNESIGRAFREIDGEYPKAKPPCNVFTRLVMDRARELDRQAPGEDRHVFQCARCPVSVESTWQPPDCPECGYPCALDTSAKLAPQPPAQEQGEDYVGILNVRRHRGIDAMVNHDFEYLGALPDGIYRLYTRAAGAEDARDAVTEGSIVALVAGPYMYHHKMDEQAEREAKAFDRCRDLTIQNIRTYFATRAAIASQAQEGEK